MRKILFSVVFFACYSTISFGQTLTAANYNPVIGDAYITNVCDVTGGISAGPSGSGLTWNFGSLVTTSIDNGITQPCSSTPNCVSGSTYAVVSTNGPLVNSFIANSSQYSQTGIYTNATTQIVYTNPMDLLRFPFSYGSTFIDTFADRITNSSTVITQQGTVTVLCDGSGDLVVPGHTFHSVLRVHSSSLYIDSTNLFGMPYIDTFQLDSYNWYMPGYHSPLMTITSAQQVNGTANYNLASYFLRAFTGVTPVNGQISSLELSPNPASDELNIKFDAPDDKKLRVSLTDMLGREVAVIANEATAGHQHLKYNTSALPKGLYLVHLQSEKENITRKLEIR